MSSFDDRGWVTPVAQDGESAMDPIEPTQRSIRSAVVGGIVLLAVIAAAVAGTILWRGRNGDPFASARSVPADMDFVATFDVLALSDSERLQSFVDAFAAPMVDAGIVETYPEDLVAAIDEALGEETDFTLSGDIMPWIGRSVTVAGSVPEFDPETYEMGDLSFLLSADVRDREAAEAFVTHVFAELGKDDIEPAATTIGGLPGYTFTDEYDDITVGLVVTDDTLLVGAEQSVADAVAAHDAGLSIADDATFNDVMGRLPDERMVSYYLSASFLDGYADMFVMGGVPQQTFTDLAGATAGSVSLVDEGVLFSYVASGSTEVAAAAPDRDIVSALPGNTLAFFSAAGAASDTGFDQEALGDFGSLLDEIYYQTGVDVTALLESLSGDMTFAVTETREGMIASETEVPIGLVGALGLKDPGPVTDLVDMLVEMFVSSGVTFEETDGVTTVSEQGQDVFSYSIGSDLLVVGTSGDLVSGVVAGGDGGPLTSDLYQELDELVLGDGLVGYADIASIVKLIPLTREEAAVVAPVRGLGIGGDSDGTVQELEVLVLVDY